MYHKRPHAEDIRAMKRRGEKISVLFVTTPEDPAAADSAGLHVIADKPFAPKFDVAMDLEAFAKAVEDGAPPPVTAETGARTLAVLDAARQSAATGKSITLCSKEHACPCPRLSI